VRERENKVTKKSTKTTKKLQEKEFPPICERKKKIFGLLCFERKRIEKKEAKI
jgi:hypothetical protein